MNNVKNKNGSEARTVLPVNGMGYVYDLYFLFLLNYNRESGYADAVNYKKSVSDTEYFSHLLSECGAFPQTLAPFFAQKDNSRCFMLTCRFGRSFCAEGDALSSLCESLSDVEAMFSDMLEYFFPKADRASLTRSSIPQIAAMIREANLDDRIKNGLYAFFIDPEGTLAVLCDTLREKASVLDRIRAEQEPSIDDRFDTFELDDFLVRAARVKDFGALPDKLYLTFCAAAKNTVELIADGTEVTVMLGTDWESALEAMEYKKRPELDSFGNVISEKHRIEILEIMARNGTVTIRDVEQELGLTGTNAYYHLNLMIKTGMVKTRTVGRTVFYSIDKDYFITVCKMIGNFTQ